MVFYLVICCRLDLALHKLCWPVFFCRQNFLALARQGVIEITLIIWSWTGIWFLREVNLKFILSKRYFTIVYRDSCSHILTLRAYNYHWRNFGILLYILLTCERLVGFNRYCFMVIFFAIAHTLYILPVFRF